MNAVILSATKETNGQNTRYVRAAEKHGAKADVIKVLAIGRSDPAGVVARFQAAAEKGDAVRIRSASNPDTSYLGFPHDLTWGQDDDEIKRLIDEADVVHLNNTDRAAQRFRIWKPMLLHHHGSLFRGNATHFLQVAAMKRMTSAVSTPDLLRFAPDRLHWLPTAYDCQSLRIYAERNRRPEDGRILVAHAPTSTLTGKGTEFLVPAIEQLQEEGLPVDLDLITGVSNAECLRRKARADILFDQLGYGYGCNAVEAWAMGLPVISGSDEWTDAKMREMWGDLPYAVASQETLIDVLRRMVKSKAIRDDYAGKGRAHVLKYHDEKPALATLAELYALTIRSFVGMAPTLDRPIRFTARPGTRVGLWIGGPHITFSDKPYETFDPYEVKALRKKMLRPSFGITELV